MSNNIRVLFLLTIPLFLVVNTVHASPAATVNGSRDSNLTFFTNEVLTFEALGLNPNLDFGWQMGDQCHADFVIDQDNYSAIRIDDTNIPNCPSMKQVKFTYSYSNPGTYTVKLGYEYVCSVGTCYRTNEDTLKTITIIEYDTDGDGMPDAYENSVGLNPTINDAGGDPDNDGILNIEEYEMQTYPFVYNTWRVTKNSNVSGGFGSDYIWLSGDINGDGLTDMIRRSNSMVYGNTVLLANGSGGWSVIQNTDFEGGVGSGYAWLTGDVNGDGRTDLIRRSNSFLTNTVFLANGSGGWTISVFTDFEGGVGSGYTWLTGDINGDGRTDLIRRSNSGGSGNAVFIANGWGRWTIRKNTDNIGGVGSGYAWLTGDVNGDGKTDLIRRTSSGVGNSVFLADSAQIWNINSNTDNNGGVGWGYVWLTGDVNGDGRTDLIRRSNYLGNAVFFANGAGSWNVQTNTDLEGGVGNGYTWLTGDVNGDGKTDLIRRSNNGGGGNAVLYSSRVRVLWFSRFGWDIKSNTDNNGGVGTPYMWFSGNVNGDSRTDLIRQSSDGLNAVFLAH